MTNPTHDAMRRMTRALREATVAIEAGFADADMRDLPGPVLEQLRAVMDAMTQAYEALKRAAPN